MLVRDTKIYFFSMNCFVSVLFFYAVNGVLAKDLDNETTTCDSNTFTNLQSKNISISTYCKDKPCIAKCCGENEILYLTKKNNSKYVTLCTNVKEINLKKHNVSLDYSDLKIYSLIKMEVKETTKTLFKNFNLIRNKVLTNPNCSKKMNNIIPKYILEDGRLAEDMGSHSNKDPWYIHDAWTFCVDRYVSKKYNMYIFYNIKLVEEDSVKIKFIVAGFVISSVFLFLVLLVYCMLPKLQNLKGKLVMAYVSTLLVAYLIRTIHTLHPFHFTWCKFFIAPLTYFVFLSSILWLNVMSYDIWWGLRGLRLQRAVNRKGELVKFLWYCLYAWGVAAAMTIVATVVDNADLTNWPNIIKPDFESCLKDEYSVIWYLYTPIGILILINLVLFLLTVYNLWLFKKELKRVQDSSNNTKTRSSFRVYFSISLLMGLSWMFEITQSFYDNESIYLFIFMNVFNILIGVVIFVMFICKESVLKSLCERFKIKTKFFGEHNTNSVTKSTVTRSRSSNKSSYDKTPNNDVENIPEDNDAVKIKPTLTECDEKNQTKTFFI